MQCRAQLEASSKRHTSQCSSTFVLVSCGDQLGRSLYFMLEFQLLRKESSRGHVNNECVGVGQSSEDE